MSIQSIITQVASLEATVSGVKHAYDTADSTINEFPAFINFPESGVINRTPNLRKTIHRIKMLLYVTDSVLASAEAELRPYLVATLDVFDTHLSLNSSAASSQIVGYKYGVLEYGGQKYLGISFDLDVTEWIPFSFAP